MAVEQRSRRNAPVAATAVLVLLGVLFAVLAVIYFTQTAGALPSFLPGHQAGSSHHHTKHGIATATLAVVCFIGAWITTGTRSAEPRASQS